MTPTPHETVAAVGAMLQVIPIEILVVVVTAVLFSLLKPYRGNDG